jgi:hypothetical protein
MIAAAVSAHESMGNVKIMFASLGAYGHLYPMMPLALAPSDPLPTTNPARTCPAGLVLPVPTSGIPHPGHRLFRRGRGGQPRDQ